MTLTTPVERFLVAVWRAVERGDHDWTSAFKRLGGAARYATELGRTHDANTIADAMELAVWRLYYCQIGDPVHGHQSKAVTTH